MESGEVVRAFFERMEARDWSGAQALMDPQARVEFTETGEQFSGERFVAMNQAYPEGWTIEIVETVALGARVAAQVRVIHAGETYWCAGFYTVRNDAIIEATEHWVTAGSAEPPAWRRPFTIQ